MTWAKPLISVASVSSPVQWDEHQKQRHGPVAKSDLDNTREGLEPSSTDFNHYLTHLLYSVAHTGKMKRKR